jgi:membrane-bound lytic murein transglycosylase A
MIRLFSLLFFCAAVIASCEKIDPEKAPLVLKPAAYEDLRGWAEDDQDAALEAFEKSCVRILKQDAAKPFGPDDSFGVYGDWQPACKALPAHKKEARAFFERWFTPWQATAGGLKDGLFTGYYEASLRGAREKGGAYIYPLLRRPPDLVMVELGDFRDELKGYRIAGRVKSGTLKPYEDRAAIVAGDLPPEDVLPLAWVSDPVGAFFLQIQGSGRIMFKDGGEMRVGYDAQNGHPYYAIGRALVKRGMKKEDVSMQSIRAWLEAHKDEAEDVMNINPSYVFFRELRGAGPLGAANIALTPGRSLAVDHARLPYGAPVWVDAAPPAPGDAPLKRLFIAQDTGGAIRGAVRGDVFWGYGKNAEEKAGVMKSPGRSWILLPKTVVPDHAS